jgi:hypothetical protein
MAFGFVVGTLMFFPLEVFMTPYFWHDLRHRWPALLNSVTTTPASLLMAGLIGMLVSLTLRIIARPRPPSP